MEGCLPGQERWRASLEAHSVIGHARYSGQNEIAYDSHRKSRRSRSIVHLRSIIFYAACLRSLNLST